MLILLRRLLLGRPLPNHLAQEERLPKRLALAVFSSDALSSTAYASEEILRTLMIVGVGSVPALAAGWPIALGIASLLVLVALSYRQTILAYPNGASAYQVTRDNLGTTAALLAAAALLLDFVLTVAVSVSAGVAALASALPVLLPYRAGLALAALAMIALVNLRGLREPQRLFAIPTYGFISAMFLLIALGLYRFAQGGVPPLPDNATSVGEAVQDMLRHTDPPQALLAALTPFAFLRAFASGCTALTGIEAISDGVPSFRKPETKNAVATLGVLIVILTTLFLGISFLADAFRLPALREQAPGYETLLSQIGRRVFTGPLTPGYYLLMASVFAVLFAAANTAFQDFPRLASQLAKDRYLPRQFADLGDRLVFQNGILLLTGLSALVIGLFHAEVSSLLPLYAIGVFTSFTLSQAAMVRHSLTRPQKSRVTALLWSGLGAVATAIVLMVLAVTKLNPPDAMPTGLRLGGFSLHYGSWLIIALLPLLVLAFGKIRRHYAAVWKALQVETAPAPPLPTSHTTLVLVPGLHKGIFPALDYALSLSSQAQAVYVELDPSATATLKEEWERFVEGVPLIVLESPYRNLREPLLSYVQEVLGGCDSGRITIILPEIDATQVTRWWHRLLHGSSSDAIRRTLSACPGVLVTSFPYFPELGADA